MKNIKYEYELKVPNGTYKADNLFWLLIAVFGHRFQHLIKDRKFMDQIMVKVKIKNSLKFFGEFILIHEDGTEEIINGKMWDHIHNNLQKHKVCIETCGTYIGDKQLGEIFL